MPLVIVVRWMQSCRGRWGWAVLGTVLLSTGCVRGPRESMGHFLESGSNRKAAVAESVPEPISSVTANSPGQTASVADVPVDETPRLKNKTLIAEVTDGPERDTSVSLNDEPRIEVPSPKEVGGPKIWDRRMVSAAAETTVNRLKKALSTDAHSTETAPIDPLSRTHPLRIKVESLHQKAAALLAAGELEEARAQAERAVDLSESLALEFLPNEEHPQDLLQRITLAIDELDLAPSASSMRFSSDDPVGRDSLPRLPIPESVPSSEFLTTNDDSVLAHPLERGTVVANRPLRLPEGNFASAEANGGTGPVEMGPILGEEPLGSTTKDPLADSGLPTFTSVDRFRSRPDSGPLLLSTEGRPSTSQVTETAPLPAFHSPAASRPATADPLTPVTGFEWVDLWPLGVLAALMLFFASGLLMRRWITGH